MEYKAVATEFKAEGDQGEYTGHFAVFGNVDDGKDRSWPGMFTKTIAENGKRVKVFFAHDWMKPIGPAPKVLEEDAAGLLASGRLTLASFYGREAWALMKDGAMNEGSFGYSAIKFDYDEEGVRNLREVKLYEISPVPLGMNPLTDVSALKALQRAHSAEEKIEVFGALVKALVDGDITEANADTWREMAKEIGGRLAAWERKQNPPITATEQMQRALRLRSAELALSGRL